MIQNPQVNTYIGQAAPFAQPVLAHLRALVHTALPNAEETIKWRMPTFMVGGRNIAGMAAFKAHCGFVIHGAGRHRTTENRALGQFGKLTSLADLPSDTAVIERLRAAATARSVKRDAARTPRAEIAIPDDLAAALARNDAARTFLGALPPSCRREYLEWITSAKRPETRARRMAQTLEQLAAGRRFNEKCQN